MVTIHELTKNSILLKLSGDGKFSKKEWKNTGFTTDKFKEIDKDKNGYINQQEVKDYIHRQEANKVASMMSNGIKASEEKTIQTFLTKLSSLTDSQLKKEILTKLLTAHQNGKPWYNSRIDPRNTTDFMLMQCIAGVKATGKFDQPTWKAFNEKGIMESKKDDWLNKVIPYRSLKYTTEKQARLDLNFYAGLEISKYSHWFKMLKGQKTEIAKTNQEQMTMVMGATTGLNIKTISGPIVNVAKDFLLSGKVSLGGKGFFGTVDQVLQRLVNNNGKLDTARLPYIKNLNDLVVTLGNGATKTTTTMGDIFIALSR